MDGKSLDNTENKIAQLRKIIPEAFTEGMIDWDKLQACLGENVEFKGERYSFDWAGKSESFKTLQATTTNTLIPCKEESINFEDTDNVFIEGDNLEALRILQKSYFGKIKMIYIDPPYNTGSGNFIYPDKFSESKKEYKKQIGVLDKSGYMTNEGLFRKNNKNSGHYHSRWLSMIYPRVSLARNLLRDDGVIFISIDDNECANLRKLMDEVFGEENFLGCAARITKKSNNKGDFWSPNFDYVLTYAKDATKTVKFLGTPNIKAYNKVEEKGPRKGEKYQEVRLYMSTIENRNPEQRFFVECPDGSKVIPPGDTFPPERPILGDGIWRWSRTKFEDEYERIVIKKGKSSNLVDESGNPTKWNVFTKTYLKDVIADASAKPNSLIEGHINQGGSHELRDLNIPFDYSKPSSLIKYLISISQTKDSDIILDFFAGSSTTAHAVLESNKEDNGERKFIMIQIPEKIDEKKPAFKEGFVNIADLSKERIRRVICKLNTEENSTLSAGDNDLGFKVFKISNSNFKLWRSEVKTVEELSTQLKLIVNPVDEKAPNENILYELLLKTGILLTSAIQKEKDYYILKNERLAVMLTKIDSEIVQEVIDEGVIKVITIDSLFNNNDQLKTNIALQMKDAGIDFVVV